MNLVSLNHILDVITMVQTLSHVDTTLTRCHSNYLAQINIEITTSSNQANDIMTKLTAVASILVPLNVITGLWGMNVKVPGMATDDSDYTWFIAIVVVSCVLYCSYSFYML
jgi:magnesium transporter